MAPDVNYRQDPGDHGGFPDQEMSLMYGYGLPYEDPAIVNPDELASFPKQVRTDGYHPDHESHLVNKRTTPVRDGRNITRTDNQPDKKGYM
jgi:hypothetical protein